ncbi:hypothetical protein I4F81_009383 [Pyropia yezoensis]|uniref:Uncharacterized protein n=1 Tax=Pyropia yezoensis TaxID=2788 RepID=A0ACC3CAS8_PYRYE|nr:hypothetical protein I4F81_009383 [Neopyropia yezoensis]
MNAVTALTTAMRDLFGGDVPIKSSPHATMVVMTDSSKQLGSKTGDIMRDIGATATFAGADWVATGGVPDHLRGRTPDLERPP